MRVISVALGDLEIARIDEAGNFRQLVDFSYGVSSTTVRQLYEACIQ